jgi:hypothetical protein
MRTVAMGLMPLVLMSCGAKYKPEGPVMGAYERAYQFPVHRPHDGLSYSGREPASTAPVIPFMAFGAAFDLDFVVMPGNGDFDMMEFARMAAPEGPIWLALESKEGSGDQTVLANLDQIASFMPELPLARQSVNLQVDDKSTEHELDVTLSYTSSNGSQVEVELAGDAPLKAGKKRNGKTFDHSQNQLLAVLDVASTESLFKANVKMDGKGVGFKKIGGIVPGQFVLSQTQGGIASGAFRVVPFEPAAGGAAYGEAAVRAPDAAPVEEAAKPLPDVLARMGVAKSFSTVTECWTRLTAEQPTLTGGAKFYGWTVTAGKVSDPKAMMAEGPDAAAVPAPDAVDACVTQAIAGWTFDESVSGQVNWQFTFQPAGAPVEGSAEPPPAASVVLNAGTYTPAAAPAPAEGAPAEGAPAAPAEGADPLTDGALPEGAIAPVAKAADLSSFSTIHRYADGTEVEQKWLVSRQGDRVTARQESDLRALEYHYRLVAESYLELVSITVEQYGRATPVTAITFNPPIPDVRWPFNGRRNSSFVIDVNGQQSYATGEVEAYWTEAGPKLHVAPKAPEWVASRPMTARINFPGDGSAEVVVERSGE